MLRDFAREQLAPRAAEWDRTSHFPREELRALGELGCCGMVVPEEWGGAGLDYVSLALALEEIAAGDGAVSTIISVQNSVVCGPINAFGTRRAEREIPEEAGNRRMAGLLLPDRAACRFRRCGDPHQSRARWRPAGC
jgi:butyryl-CoA dehydrogenase